MQFAKEQARGYQSSPQSVVGYIRAEWSELTNEEISNLTRNRHRFYDAVKRKYGLTPEVAETQLHQWERVCRGLQST